MEKILETNEYGWMHATLALNGVKLGTIQRISLNQSIEKTPVRGHSRYVSFFKTGNIDYKGTATFLHSDFSALVGRGIDLTREAFIMTINFRDENAMRTYLISGCHFTQWDFEIKRGDLTSMVTLPFVATRVIVI